MRLRGPHGRSPQMDSNPLQWPPGDELTNLGILINHRLILPGDELALLPDEVAAFAGSVVKVRRASGAARIAARELLAQLGQPQRSVPKSDTGMPVWPEGIVGSLAHDAQVAIATVARRRDFSGLGVDIEPAQPLDADLLDLVTTEGERRSIAVDPYHGRLLFVIKEAVYKAVYPLDRVFLNHHDVEVDIRTRTATTCTGRVVEFRYCLSSHIVAVAFVPPDDA